MSEMTAPPQNHLLAALPAEVRNRMLPHLEGVPMPFGKVLYESGDLMRHVYFPIDCIVSMLYVMESGASTEISMVGNEGFVGVAMLMGGGTTGRAVVQSAGHAWRLPASRLREEFEQHGDLQDLVLRYTQSLLTQMAQTAACNRHHTIDQQLCRWLLLSLDRLPDNHLTMTQELIANMLGVRREGVTEAACKLQKRGVIEYSRGHITVLDRPALEQLSCECYAVVKQETDRLLPWVPVRRGGGELRDMRVSQPSHQHQDEDDDQHQPQAARGRVAPVATVRPGRQDTEQHQDQDD
jgi:CRP-like cAMP-binding protein